MLTSPFFRGLGFDSEWIHFILEEIRLNKEMDEDNTRVDEKEEGCSQIRMRLRLLRFSILLLPRNTPDESVVKCLGHSMDIYNKDQLASDSGIVSDHFEHDAYLEAKAVVSLLRHLYSPLSEESSQTLTWRNVIHSAIESAFNNNEELGLDMVHCGIGFYLSGMPGRISVGSYVLLKPSAATSLSVSAPLLTKSHGSFTLLGAL